MSKEADFLYELAELLSKYDVEIDNNYDCVGKGWCWGTLDFYFKESGTTINH